MAIYMWREPAPITTAGIYHSPEQGLISLSSDGSTWITIADKNLGATQVYNDGDTLSEANGGKRYQRGNNYGFPFTGATSSTASVVSTSGYGGGTFYSSSTYRCGSNSSLQDRSSNRNDDLRGYTTGTYEAKKGPCDINYHIPTATEWGNIKTIGITISARTQYDGNMVKKLLKLPYTGYTGYTSKTVNGTGTEGWYWTVQPYDRYNIYMLQIASGTFQAGTDIYTYRSAALSIRPFANTPAQPDESRTVLYQ